MTQPAATTNPHDTEAKQWWVKEFGPRYEARFVNEVCPRLGLIGQINPAKAQTPWAPDLIVNGALADLKYRYMPFFNAGKLYGIDPQYAVAFNQKDHKHYGEKWPDLVIYFWVWWQQFSALGVKVAPMSGVWRVAYKTLARAIASGDVPLHRYQRRQAVNGGMHDANGNGAASYLFDVRDFTKLAKVIGPAAMPGQRKQTQ